MADRVPIAPHPEGMRSFVSGPANTAGMGARYVLVGDLVEGEWVAKEPLAGWGDLAHGTVFAALHDEAAIFVIGFLAGQVGLTTRMDVRFLKPIRLGQRVRIRGRLAKSNDRGATVASEIRLPDDSVASTAETDYAFVDETTLARVLGRPLRPESQALFRADPARRRELALSWSRQALGPTVVG